MNPRRRIALICDSLEDDFQAALITSGLAAAAAHGVDLVVIPGGKLGQPGSKRFILDAVAPPWADGIIVAAHTIGHVATEKEMVAFLEHLRPIPTVALGEVPGADCCLVVENEPAVYAITQHLVEQHGYRRFAFVSGPTQNIEARARRAGFHRALEEARLDPADVVEVVGDFTWEGGRQAICALVDERGVDVERVDAVICANDAMAIGACVELERRDVYVPRDVAVVGFDDTELARHLPAPLTTARQPIGDLLFDAMRSLLGALDEGRAPCGNRRYEAEPIFRRSCGCARLPHLPNPSASPASVSPLEDVMLETVRAVQEALDATFATSLADVRPTWLEECLGALFQQLHDESTVFFDTLESLCFDLLRAGRPTRGWQHALLVIRRHASRRIALDRKALSELDRAIDGALRLTSEVATSFIVRQREELLEHFKILSHATAKLLAAPDLRTIAEVAEQDFPKLGVRRGIIGLFGDPFGAEAKVTPLCAFGLPSGTAERGGIEPFSLSSLAPSELLAGHSWVVEPLDTGRQPVGIAVLECGLAQASWYERLRDALAAAIQGAQLIQEVQNLVVTDPLTGLSNRRHLTEKMRQELESERGASWPLSLLVLDLDGFKRLNDEHGHDRGDRALIEAAKLFRQCLRDTDTLARFGGDEFVAILPGTNAENAAAVARRVLKSLPSRMLEAAEAPLTCSIGIATTDGKRATNQVELFRLADQALLAAKRLGKNRVVHAYELAG